MNRTFYVSLDHFKIKFLFMAILLIMAILNSVFASDSEISPKSDNAIKMNPLSGFIPDNNSAQKPSMTLPAVWCSNIDEDETKDLCWKAYQNGLNYYKFGLSHRESVLKWQHISTKIILFVVLTLVGMGLYFAWVQFKSGDIGQAENKVELSSSGIKVSSPVLGVIILALSLGFFYLYLVYVYPIQETI